MTAMATRTSAGIILYRRTGAGLEVLLAHPGGPFFAKRDAGPGRSPRANRTGKEPLFTVAQREFAEETGHPVPAGPLVELGSIVQKGGKVVHAWAVEGDLDPDVARSNSFEMEWPPKSGRTVAFPEIDRVGWFDPTEARVRIKSTQIPLLERLETALGVVS